MYYTFVIFIFNHIFVKPIAWNWRRIKILHLFIIQYQYQYSVFYLMESFNFLLNSIWCWTHKLKMFILLTVILTYLLIGRLSSSDWALFDTISISSPFSDTCESEKHITYLKPLDNLFIKYSEENITLGENKFTKI